MKLLHTSDWHLGRILHTRKRYEEFARFLNWLAQYIKEEQIDALLIAGDVFDSSTPSNRAQELYYSFLRCVMDSQCHHVVVIAGNHDSPSLLNAPRNILRFFNVHVIGCVSESLEDEVLVLRDDEGLPKLVVCAVPYLRDRDVRNAEAGESVEDKGTKLIEGIREHYQKVCNIAKQKRDSLNTDVPIIAMGHLFTAGGRTVDGDGVRELYVGSLAYVQADVFPPFIDYLALGHLHVPQMVSGSSVRRYSGSPVPMSFNEAEKQKHILEITFSDNHPTVKEIPVPCFQQMCSIRGDIATIAQKLEELGQSDSAIWLEIIYEGDELVADLQERVQGIVAGTKLEILRTKNTRVFERAMRQINMEDTLDDLNPEDVFRRCLADNNVPETQHSELINAFNEIITALHEDDALAE